MDSHDVAVLRHSAKVARKHLKLVLAVPLVRRRGDEVLAERRRIKDAALGVPGADLLEECPRPCVLPAKYRPDAPAIKPTQPTKRRKKGPTLVLPAVKKVKLGTSEIAATKRMIEETRHATDPQ
eukprot:gnl/Dysnectes_brevis/2253_a2639_1406.p5 GENE.gnl/Dysnectes_brevis/2253_a2639_1406~~gnl/Dysnectes_brevis/2253_a2639_1406.p5  ORF type:complete len:124 (+),score=21.27 gnl/Dysnectes_brevis/2253_a2639_1406:1538-1909(+)